MELRDLRYFVQVAKDKRFTKAATHLYVSQPAVSKSVRRLEDELATQLFDNKEDGVYLTDCGEVLYNKAAEILQQFDSIKDAVESVKKAESGHLAIGITPMINELFGGEILLKFYQQYPDIELKVTEAASITLQKLLEDRQVDLSVYIPSGNRENNEDILLYSDQMAVCMSADNPLSKNTILTFSDLKSESFNLYSSSSVLYSIVMDCCQNAGYVPKVSFSSSNINSIITMTANGSGVFILPRPYAEHILRPNLAVIPLGDAVPWRIFISREKNYYQSYAAKLFTAHVMDYFKEKFANTNGK